MTDRKIRAAGGVLFRIENGSPLVLLIYRNGVWDLPKGKLEEGESVPECAAREVSEETGSAIPEVGSYLTETYHEYSEEKQRIGKYTDWYAMTESGQGDNRPQTEEGITKTEWVPLNEALNRVGYENLKQVLEAFQNTVL